MQYSGIISIKGKESKDTDVYLVETTEDGIILRFGAIGWLQALLIDVNETDFFNIVQPTFLSGCGFGWGLREVDNVFYKDIENSFLIIVDKFINNNLNYGNIYIGPSKNELTNILTQLVLPIGFVSAFTFKVSVKEESVLKIVRPKCYCIHDKNKEKIPDWAEIAYE